MRGFARVDAVFAAVEERQLNLLALGATKAQIEASAARSRVLMAALNVSCDRALEFEYESLREALITGEGPRGWLLRLRWERDK